MTYAWFVLFQRCASHRTMHMSYRSKTYTWNDVILVKRSMIGVLSCLIQVGMSRGTYAANLRSIIISRMTRDRTCTMVLRNSRSIQSHLIGTGCELSYCDMRAAGCAFAWRSHLTNLFFVLHSDVTSRDGLTSRFLMLWRHVAWRSDVTFSYALTSRFLTLWRHVFTSRPPAIRHIHVNKMGRRESSCCSRMFTLVCVVLPLTCTVLTGSSCMFMCALLLGPNKTFVLGCIIIL